ncbi:hypothetical protein Sango_0911000 [Sesamum angolense]|uniref:Plant Basic Secretory Protein n=1 Tax=Sesamum angolense TaxID=2727404 RepID=A0AAE2BXU6_9LAMI|nr:hypothetical protein Sango_0911000 [Sesamum angolense]
MGKKKNLYLSLTSLLLIPSSLRQGILAVKFIVTNNARNLPGGLRFDREIGIPYTLQTMSTINQFIWNLFEQHSYSERKNIPVLNVFISDFTGAAAYTNGDFNINVSAQVIQSYPPGPGKARFRFTSLMYHEMAHIFQWSGNRTAPGGLTEGIADYEMIKSSVYWWFSYTRPGEGSRWDEGYGVTERFLEYCDSLRKGFTVELNKKMRYAYSDGYFVELLGKPVRQLWADYKKKYGNTPVGEGYLLPDEISKTLFY